MTGCCGLCGDPTAAIDMLTVTDDDRSLWSKDCDDVTLAMSCRNTLTLGAAGGAG